MKFIKTQIEGVVIIEPNVFSDSRGSFSETYIDQKFREATGCGGFIQDNESYSHRNVIRGLHYQTGKYAQAKLVRAVRGHIIDVAVDMRKSSPTFGKWVAVELSDQNHRQLFIPQGFAHGFRVMSQDAVVVYKCDNYYAPQHEGGVVWNDPQLNIDWGAIQVDAVVSDKDAILPRFDKAIKFE